MKKYPIVCACLLFLSLGSCSRPSPSGTSESRPSAPPELSDQPEYVVRENISFSGEGAASLKLDIVLPKDPPGPKPCILYLPGNSYGMDARWTASKKQYSAQMIEAAKRGFVAAAADQRLLPRLVEAGVDVPFEAMMEDVRAALRFLADHAGEYGIDRTRIAVLGWSSGGHLALQAAFEGVDPGGKYGGASEYPIAAAAVSCAPTDMVKLYRSDAAQSSTFPEFLEIDRKLMGGDYENVPDRYAKASPVRYLRADSPPVILVSGLHDSSVPPEQADLVEARLKAVGARYRILRLEKSHGDYLREPEVWVFLEEVLSPGK